MPGHYPDAHDSDRHREAQQLSCCESAATSERHSCAIGAWTDDVLTHRKEEKSKSNGGDDCKRSEIRKLTVQQFLTKLTCCTDGEEHLHRVKEEKHHEE